MECNYSKRRSVSNIKVKVEDHIISQVSLFKYLWSVLQSDGEIEGDVNHQIQDVWLKWRTTSGVLCDINFPLKLKEFFYQTAVKPAMFYEIKC